MCDLRLGIRFLFAPIQSIIHDFCCCCHCVKWVSELKTTTEVTNKHNIQRQMQIGDEDCVFWAVILICIIEFVA